MRQRSTQNVPEKILRLFSLGFDSIQSPLTHSLRSIGIAKAVIGGDVGIGQRLDRFFFRLAVFVQIGFVGVASTQTLRTKAEVLGEHYLFCVFQAIVGFIQLIIKLLLEKDKRYFRD